MTEALTHSKRQAFQNCNRYFFLRHERNLSLRAAKPGRRRGRVFGDAIQAARDRLEALKDVPEDSPNRPVEPVAVAVGSVEESYRELEETGAVRDQDDADSLAVEEVKVGVMVAAYIERYGLAPRREVEFYLPLVRPLTGFPSRTFTVAGKLDGLEVTGKKHGRVIEDKFVGSVQKAMIDRLPLDAQSSEYVDALLSHGWTAEVAYRHTRYPGLNPAKPRVYKVKDDYPGETLDEFGQRLREDVAARLDFYFDQQLLFFPTRRMESYRAGRYGVAKQIAFARQVQRTDGWEVAWPQNSSRCWEFGGCEFIPLCTLGDEALDRYEEVVDNVELSGEGANATDTYGTDASQTESRA